MTDHEMIQDQPKTNVYQKIAMVMASVGAIEKDKANTYQNFKYVSKDQLYTVLRSRMATVNLICLPAITNKQIVDGQWLLDYEFTLVDGDNPESLTSRQWFQSIPVNARSKTKDGYMEYFDDKAIGKANTYSERYFLMNLFLISDGEDDIEASDPAEQYPAQAKPVQEIHWTNIPEQVKEFYAHCKLLPLPPKDRQQIFEALEVEKISDCNLSMADAITTVSEHMEELARMEGDKPVVEDQAFDTLCKSLLADKEIKVLYTNIMHVKNTVTMFSQEKITDPLDAGYAVVKQWMLDRKKNNAYTNAQQADTGEKKPTTLDSIPF